MDKTDIEDGIVFREAGSSQWDDMEKLFESRGGPKNCWCMVWRGKPGDRTDKTSRKAAMHKLVKEEVPVGLLGYLDDEPVAWCSIAPRSTYRKLGGLEESGEDSENIWSLVCFYVKSAYRGQGLMNRLIEAAKEHSIKRGATVIEAYPVDPDSPSYRFMGFVPVFKDMGFIKVGEAGSRRHVMRLKL